MNSKKIPACSTISCKLPDHGAGYMLDDAETIASFEIENNSFSKTLEIYSKYEERATKNVAGGITHTDITLDTQQGKLTTHIEVYGISEFDDTLDIKNWSGDNLKTKIKALQLSKILTNFNGDGLLKIVFSSIEETTVIVFTIRSLFLP